MKLLLTSLLVFTSLLSYAQLDSTLIKTNYNPNKNVVCVEFLGANSAVSLNYERSFLNRKHFFMDARVGLGTLLVLWSSTYSMSGNFGGRNHFLELGVGRTDYTVFVPFLSSSGASSFYYPLIGYKYQKKFVFKFQILQLALHKNNQLINNPNNNIVLFAGISFGVAF
ncbi:MAG: hypothetical protein H7331_12420 [Bacteroidia bacterium]|nr:hypothetical protein [Bacteroidia bacterium]